MRDRIILIGSLGVLLAAVGLLWLQESQTTEKVAPTAAEITTAANSPATPATPVVIESIVERPPFATPLPERDAPLGKVFDDLLRRADQGDRKAACRVGLELLRCRRWSARQQQFPESFSEQGDSRRTRIADIASDRLDIDKLATTINAVLGQFPDYARPLVQSLVEAELSNQTFSPLSADGSRQCEQIPAATQERAVHYLRQAAMTGSVDAMIHYASGRFWLEGGGKLIGSYDFIRDPAFDQWRREAPMLLQGALQRGAPEAVMLMVDSAGLGSHMLSGLTSPNGFDEAVAQQLLARLLDAPDPPTGAVFGLDKIQAAKASERADALFEQHFGSRPADNAVRRLYLPYRLDADDPRALDAPCEEPVAASAAGNQRPTTP